MRRPPFFAFYPADFANDINVEAMSTLQVGAYILLLCKAWQSNPPASLPASDTVLARLARVDAETWQEIKAGVLVAFQLGEDGRLHNKRLRREFDASVKRIEAARENGRKGGLAKHGAVNPEEPKNLLATLVAPLDRPLKQPLKHSSSGAQATQIGELEEKDNPPKPPAKPGGGDGAKRTRRRASDAESDPRFLRFWSAYPRKAGKPAAARAFVKLAPDDATLEAMLAAVASQRKSPQWVKDGGEFIPHPATWLNQRRWEDEATAADQPPVHRDLFAEFRAKHVDPKFGTEAT